MNESLESIKNDVAAIGTLYKLFDNPNINNETIEKLEKILVDYCKRIINILDEEGQMKNIEVSMSLDKMFKLLNNHWNKVEELSYSCIADIVKDTEDDAIKGRAIKGAVDIYNQTQWFSSEYNKEAEKFNQMQ